MIGCHGELTGVRWRWLAVVLELGKHLLEGQAEGLQLLFFQPQRAGVAGLADKAQTKRTLARLPERLGIDAAREAEVGGQLGGSLAANAKGSRETASEIVRTRSRSAACAT
jgi:hypothetical protein